MNTHQKIVTLVVSTILIGFVALLAFLLRDQSIAMLEPKGLIALKERDLMVNTIGLMLIVVIPVFILLAAFSWRYRASNVTATYRPNWEHNKIDEVIWWSIPILIIAMLSVVSWKSTHELDPWRPLASEVKPLTVQVVALDWKWLFIYPEQGVATVNFVEFPEQTPVQFVITSDAPMNSFAIPHLGGQIYAMSGARTEINLIANESGEFPGMSANFSGRGFAGMKFVAKAVPQAEFDAWVQETKQGSGVLNQGTYEALAKPSENNPVTSYAAVEGSIFDNVIMKYMMPAHSM